MGAMTADLPQTETTAQEALELAPIAHARIVGSQRFLIGYQFLGLLGGMLIGSVAAALLPLALLLIGVEASWGDQWLVSLATLIQLLTVVMGFAMGVNAGSRRHSAKFLKGIRTRGTPKTLRVSYAVEPDAFHIRNDRVDYRIAWPSIQEVIPAPEHWLLQVDLTSFILPKRAFASEGQEKAFLADLMARLAPEARDRSPEAQAFTAT